MPVSPRWQRAYLDRASTPPRQVVGTMCSRRRRRIPEERGRLTHRQSNHDLPTSRLRSGATKPRAAVFSALGGCVVVQPLSIVSPISAQHRLGRSVDRQRSSASPTAPPRPLRKYGSAHEVVLCQAPGASTPPPAGFRRDDCSISAHKVGGIGALTVRLAAPLLLSGRNGRHGAWRRSAAPPEEVGHRASFRRQPGGSGDATHLIFNPPLFSP